MSKLEAMVGASRSVGQHLVACKSNATSFTSSNLNCFLSYSSIIDSLFIDQKIKRLNSVGHEKWKWCSRPCTGSIAGRRLISVKSFAIVNHCHGTANRA